MAVQPTGGALTPRLSRPESASLIASSLSSSASDAESSSIDLSLDERLYRVRISRATGIEWGTDLSFAFVYVRAMEPGGAADLSGVIAKGDQLCECRPVSSGTATNLMGAPFDFVMEAFASLDKNVQELDLVFFRGTKAQLKTACGSSQSDPENITITVVTNKGSPEETTVLLKAPMGANVRQALTDAGINVYQSVTRWTNCKGKQLCGTCIVNVKNGGMSTNRKSMDEESTLRENPESYRLSCVMFAYGDVTVETFPPVNKAQWTR